MFSKDWKGNHGGGSSAVYGLGFVGALVYYIQHATTFVGGLVGIVKAMIWPALFVYRLIQLLKI